MSLFNCPHCYHPFGLFELAEQEVNLLENPIELGVKSFTLLCQNCLDSFPVTRDVTVEFKTIAQ